MTTEWEYIEGKKIFFHSNSVQSTYIDYLFWVRYLARCVGTNRVACIMASFPQVVYNLFGQIGLAGTN